MLTSFFSKSKPINYAIIGLLMLYYFLAAQLNLNANFSNSTIIFKGILGFLTFTISVAVLNNLIKRNKVTQQNTFTILFFVIFTGLIPPVLNNFQILVSGLFMILSFRRLIGLRNKKNLKLKFFDAAFWLGCATLVFEAAFPLLILPFIAVFIYKPEKFRNWLIPIIAYITVLMLAFCISYLYDNSLFGLFNFKFDWNFNFDTYWLNGLILPLSVILALNLWLFFHFIKVVNNSKRQNKASLYLIFWFWTASIFSVIFTGQKEGSELIYFIVPMSIANSLYFQERKEIVFKEILLIGLTLFALVIPFIYG